MNKFIKCSCGRWYTVYDYMPQHVIYCPSCREIYKEPLTTGMKHLWDYKAPKVDKEFVER